MSIGAALSLGFLLAHDDAQPLNIARQHRPPDIALEAVDGMIRTAVQAMGVSLVQVSNLPWNRCPVCPGITVQFALDWVSSLPWNRCPLYVEYAMQRRCREYCSDQGHAEKIRTGAKRTSWLVGPRSDCGPRLRRGRVGRALWALGCGRDAERLHLLPYMVRPAMQEGNRCVWQKEKLQPYIRHRVEEPSPVLVP